MQPPWKREVNKEIFFTCLRSYCQVNYYYSLLYALYSLCFS